MRRPSAPLFIDDLRDEVVGEMSFDMSIELKLLEYAHKVSVQAELVRTYERNLDKISADAARHARKNILEAIARLQSFERSLGYRVQWDD
jgi:hypothetical protein